MRREPTPPGDVRGARVLALFGDSLTTDHISPAGSIAKDSPAGKYLIGLGVQPKDFNSYGARRGNHEVMLRGTFANIRLRNQLVGMGVLPLQFLPGESAASLGLSGRETYDVEGIAAGLAPGKRITVRARGEDGKVRTFQVVARVDTPDDVEYYRHGGLLPYVL